ncbi:MAG: TIM barrel protein [Clostridia bacterium]|nr:TIM barrel protein [Clostridia bacterium]
MNFTVCIPCFFPKDPFEKALEKIKRSGFSYAECWRIEDERLKEAKEAVQNTGVPIVSMCTDDFVMNDMSHTEKWLRSLEKSLEKAEALGAKLLITQVGQDTGEDRQIQREAILRALEGAGPMLASSGITLMPEPLNTKYDHKGYYLDTAEECRDIVRIINHENIRMVLDFYHQQASGGDLISTFLDMKNEIRHVHIASNPGRREPWTGETNYENVFASLSENGYTGFVGLEYLPALAPENSLSEFARRFIKAK